MHLAGDAATSVDQIPWLITSDLDIVVLVISSGDGSVEKRLMTVSEVLCWITRVRGQTEATMLDHDLEPLMKDYEPKKAYYVIHWKWLRFNNCKL